jgi:hypothetical protein
MGKIIEYAKKASSSSRNIFCKELNCNHLHGSQMKILCTPSWRHSYSLLKLYVLQRIKQQLWYLLICDHIKKEVWLFIEDIHRIKMHLISRYCDLRSISEAKTWNLSKLKHPPASSKSQIEYFKQVYQTLLQLKVWLLQILSTKKR